jgi:hypothetical protein
MKISLKLDQMTTEEKLRAMELIWDDLCRNAPDFPSPEWHKDVLEKRDQLVKEGREEYIDWETAKKNIRDSTS